MISLDKLKQVPLELLDPSDFDVHVNQATGNLKETLHSMRETVREARLAEKHYRVVRRYELGLEPKASALPSITYLQSTHQLPGNQP